MTNRFELCIFTILFLTPTQKCRYLVRLGRQQDFIDAIVKITAKGNDILMGKCFKQKELEAIFEEGPLTKKELLWALKLKTKETSKVAAILNTLSRAPTHKLQLKWECNQPPTAQRLSINHATTSSAFAYL